MVEHPIEDEYIRKQRIMREDRMTQMSEDMTEDINQKPKKKPMLFRKKLLLCVFVAAMVYSGVAIFSQSGMLSQLEAERHVLEQELAELEHEYELMEAKEELVDTDTHVTQVARESLGLVKEGEIVFTDEGTDTNGVRLPEALEDEQNGDIILESDSAGDEEGVE